MLEMSASSTNARTQTMALRRQLSMNSVIQTVPKSPHQPTIASWVIQAGIHAFYGGAHCILALKRHLVLLVEASVDNVTLRVQRHVTPENIKLSDQRNQNNESLQKYTELKLRRGRIVEVRGVAGVPHEIDMAAWRARPNTCLSHVTAPLNVTYRTCAFCVVQWFLFVVVLHISWRVWSFRLLVDDHTHCVTIYRQIIETIFQVQWCDWQQVG